MAETFLNRVNAYIGTTYSNNNILADYLTEGARQVIDLVRDDVLMPFVTPSALPRTGISYKDKRMLRIYKGGYISQEIDGIYRERVKDEDSIFYATEESPRHYTESGKLYIEPGGGTSDSITYPAVLHSSSDISVLPKNLHDAVILHAAIRVLIQLGNEAIKQLAGISINDIMSSEITAPGIPTLTTIVFNAVGAPVLSGEVLQAPDFTPIYGAVASALSYTNAITYINTNQDTELAQAELAKLRTQLEEWGINVQEALNKFNNDLTIFNANLQQKLEQARLNQEALLLEYKTNTDIGQLISVKEMEAIYQNNVLAIQRYGAQTEIYLGELNSRIMQLQALIQKSVAVVQAYETKAEHLRKLYQELLTIYV